MSLTVASGSNDVIKSGSKKSVSLDLVSIKAYLTGMSAYIGNRVTLDTVRPLNMFFGISGPSLCFSPAAFNAPVKKLDKSTYEKFQSRLKLNFAFFLSNYALLTVGVALVTALMHPGMVLSLGLIWVLWGLHTFLISNELILFGKNIGTLISISHRSTVLMILTAFVIIWKCLKPSITVVAISGLMILVHALLRDPSHVTSSEFQTGSSFRSSSSDSDDETHESEVLVEKPGHAV